MTLKQIKNGTTYYYDTSKVVGLEHSRKEFYLNFPHDDLKVSEEVFEKVKKEFISLRIITEISDEDNKEED